MTEKKNDKKSTSTSNYDSKAGCGTVIFLAIIIAIVFGGCHSCSHNSNSSSSKPTTAQIAKKKSEQRAKAKKKAKKQKEEKEDLAKLQSDLKNAPKKTDNLITKARLTDNSLELTLNSEAESGTDAQLKTLCRSAWNYGAHLYNYYEPFPDGKWDNMIITVQDPAGNELATTGAFGNFKYEGNK